ncbi:MAG: FAD-binding protein, partial [Burkholderiales bacterium]|nr:FAD-binding protein [Burkholderiales bacterium]
TFQGFLDPYRPGDWRNASRIRYAPMNYIDAALAINEGSAPPDYAAGPQWAIFDAGAIERERWNLDATAVRPGYFFSAATLAELAPQLSQCAHQKVPMPAANLQETVRRYNRMVDLGTDEDFGKPSPRHKIATPPFHAAWATLTVHDTYAGLRINMKCQVMDTRGEVIPGLYCGGESAGGCSQHGTGRALTQGYIAGKEAACDPG